MKAEGRADRKRTEFHGLIKASQRQRLQRSGQLIDTVDLQWAVVIRDGQPLQRTRQHTRRQRVVPGAVQHQVDKRRRQVVR